MRLTHGGAGLPQRAGISPGVPGRPTGHPPRTGPGWWQVSRRVWSGQPALNASTAARSSGTASGYPTAIRVAKPSSSRSVSRRRPRPGPAVPAAPARATSTGVVPDGVLAGDQRRLQGLEEHRADQGRVGRINGGDGVQQEAGGVLVPREEHGDRGPQALRRHVQSRFRQPGRRQVQHGLGERHRPRRRDAPGPRRGAARHGPAGPGVSSAARARNVACADVAAAPFRARGRALEVSRDILRPGTTAGRGAVPCRLVRVAVAAQRCSPGPRAPGAGHPTGRPRRPQNGSAGAGTPPAGQPRRCPAPRQDRRRRAPGPAARPPARARRGHRPTPPRRAAAR